MVDDLEYTIDKMSGDQLEQLLPGFLRERGYDVKETDRTGKDDGVDAYITLNDESGIAHASKRKDWRRKIREDSSKVAKLEKNGEDVDILVYLTNKSINERQVRELEREIKEEYGWTFKLFHKANLIGTLEADAPNLAEKYLDVEIGRKQDHLDEIQNIVDGRLDNIRSRDGFISELIDGPVVVLHLIPSGISSGSAVERVNDLPVPPMWGNLLGHQSPGVTGNGKYTHSRKSSDKIGSYTYLRIDGLFEAVCGTVFAQDEDEKWFWNTAHSGSWLDRNLIITAKAGLNRLQEIGFNGNIHAVVTFVDVEGYRTTIESRPYELRGSNYPRFKRNEYQTRLVDIPVSAGQCTEENGRYVIKPDDPIYTYLEPILTQYWQELGEKSGCPYFDEERNWTAGKYIISK